MHIFSKILKTYFLSLVLMSAQNILASTEDEYLKQLEMEMNNGVDEQPSILDIDSSINVTDDNSLEAPESESELILEKKELINDRTGFEKALHVAYPESYELYVQLNEEQKNSIYQEFKKNKRLYNSSVKSISIYLSSH